MTSIRLVHDGMLIVAYEMIPFIRGSHNRRTGGPQQDTAYHQHHGIHQLNYFILFVLGNQWNTKRILDLRLLDAKGKSAPKHLRPQMVVKNGDESRGKR